MAPPPPDRRPRRDGSAGGGRGGGAGGRGARGGPSGERGSEPRRDDDRRRRNRDDERDKRERRAPRTWGGIARRGTRELSDAEPGSASDAWRQAVERGSAREPWEPDRWERVPDEPAASGRPARRPTPKRPARTRKAPEPVAAELAHVAGPKRAPRLEQRLMDAARAYERERYADARRMVARLAEEAPASAAVRELHGLTLYRLGKWRDAVKELEAYRTLTGSVDQHPVLADSYRALKKYRNVEALWDELRAASPGAELVAEGRIVAAGALADQGRIDEAIALLERGRLSAARPRDHHLRLWYALADLYERGGDVPRARELFRRVATHEADFADVAERLSALG